MNAKNLFKLYITSKEMFIWWHNPFNRRKPPLTLSPDLGTVTVMVLQSVRYFCSENSTWCKDDCLYLHSSAYLSFFHYMSMSQSLFHCPCLYVSPGLCLSLWVFFAIISVSVSVTDTVSVSFLISVYLCASLSLSVSHLLPLALSKSLSQSLLIFVPFSVFVSSPFLIYCVSQFFLIYFTFCLSSCAVSIIIETFA